MACHAQLLHGPAVQAGEVCSPGLPWHAARMLFPRLQRAASLPLSLRGEHTPLSRLAQKLQGTFRFGFGCCG